MSDRFDAWVGRSEEARDTITARAARQLAGTLDHDASSLVDGIPLPPLWHWLGWQTEAPMACLGPDGHPARGGFLPPVALERRMWAGGRLTFHAPLVIGAAMHRRSSILRVEEKTGNTGPMVFVTVEHRIDGPDGPAITEEQDIVFVAMPDRFTPPPPVAPPTEPAWSESLTIDSTRLFRFSALTFNAHRIHYDLSYAMTVERYPGLVVHGPLQAMLLLGAAIRHAGGASPQRFRFRGVHPAFDTDPMLLAGQARSVGEQALATVAVGHVCMQATVGWAA